MRRVGLDFSPDDDGDRFDVDQSTHTRTHAPSVRPCWSWRCSHISRVSTIENVSCNHGCWMHQLTKAAGCIDCCYMVHRIFHAGVPTDHDWCVCHGWCAGRPWSVSRETKAAAMHKVRPAYRNHPCMRRTVLKESTTNWGVSEHGYEITIILM